MKLLTTLILLTLPVFGQLALDAATEKRIPSGSRIWIKDSGDGFSSFMSAALENKKVPLVVVSERDTADFELRGTSTIQRAGTAKIIFGTGLPAASASAEIINIKSGVIVFAISESRRDALRGQRSVAEYLAKKIGAKVRDDQKLAAVK